MGTVVSLADRRRTRTAPAVAAPPRPARATFYFDLSSPATYLVAERADRSLQGLVWKPVLEEAAQLPAMTFDHAERRAHELGLPFVRPEELSPATVRPAMRVASLAAERGRAAPFVFAATRLAYCGGFELDHPEVLAEAAAAAGLDLAEVLRAAGDVRRDGPMEEAARKLLAAGADALPAVRVGRTLFAGEHRFSDALAAAHAPTLRAG